MSVETPPGAGDLGVLFQRSRDENVLNSVLLELTYSCNLDCSFCYNDLNLRGRRLGLADYETLLDDIAAMGVLQLTFSGGEPLMYRHFFELGRRARKLGFVITVKTNAVPLNRANAKRLRDEVDPYKIETSLHGATAGTHDRLTRVPGSFERLWRNVEVVQSLGMRINLNVPLTAWNEHQVAEMFDLADRHGVSLRFDPDITPRDDGDTSPLALAPSREGVENMLRLTTERALARAADQDTLPLRLKPYRPPGAESKPEARPRLKICGAGSTNLAVDPFGNVYPCVQFRRRVGNVHDQPISRLWRGSAGLAGVRATAADAYALARGEGIEHYCMGSAELKTGSALEIPDAALEIARLQERLCWDED